MSDSSTDEKMPAMDAALPEGRKDGVREKVESREVSQQVSGEASPEIQELTDEIVGALKSVYDPEIPVDIYELGLIYRVEVTDDRDVNIDMTLTAPGCPVAEHMPVWVQDAVGALDGIGDVKVSMVFEPPWDPSRMSDEARVALNMF